MTLTVGSIFGGRSQTRQERSLEQHNRLVQRVIIRERPYFLAPMAALVVAIRRPPRYGKLVGMASPSPGRGPAGLKKRIVDVPVLGQAARKLYSLMQPDSVRFENMVLPAPELRFGGEYFKADQAFAEAARKEADRLVRHCGLTLASSLVEIGCGPGRLPIGIIDRVGEIRSYHGLDVSRNSVAWCKKHIARRHPSYRFVHIDVVNSRYNEGGTIAQEKLRLPLDNNSADIIFLYSVFSHLKTNDVQAYLGEFARLLRALTYLTNTALCCSIEHESY